MKVLTNAEAFAPVDGEISIPINYNQHPFEFTRGWFRQRNQLTWSTFLKPMFEVNKPISAIQVGVFEFADAAWLMQNVLSHPSSTLVGIDPWEETTKLSKEYMEACYKRSKYNSLPWTDKVKLLRGYSQKYLPNLPMGQYDLIIIDGDHNALAVFDDALNSLRLLKNGGILVFDDVRNRIKKKNHVIHGIEMFLKENEDKVELKWQHRYADCYVKL